MPTYEYECKKCGYRFELFQSMTDKPKKRCPKCKGPLRRLFGTGSGIIFKGSGFYATDYRSKEYQDKFKKDKEKQKTHEDKSKDKESKPKENK